jgi:APA family basic amino acid/polyamine antiporter
MSERTKLGYWTCVALVVGNVIGIGIFLLPASLAPYGLNALIGWLIVAVGCLALAGVFSRLARAFPEADGPYGYIRQTLGDVPAYMALWSYWIAVWLANAAIAAGVVGYLGVVFPQLAAIRPDLLALCLVWAMVLVNLLGLRSGGRTQVVTTVLKLLPMLAIALVGAWVLLTAPTAYVAHLPQTPITLHSVMAASTIALFAMLGIESASVPAARVANPGRTIPRATLVGTTVTALIYIIVSGVPLLLIPQQVLGTAEAPFALVMDRFGIAGSARWLALFVVISGVGCLNGWTLLVGQLTRTMASNGLLPSTLGRTNRYGTPVTALIVTGVLASVMIWMSYSKSLVEAFTFITRAVTAANLPLYLGCSLALLVLWRRTAGTRGALAAGLTGMAGTAYAVFAFLGVGREPSILAAGLIVAGLPLYAVLRVRHRNKLRCETKAH